MAEKENLEVSAPAGTIEANETRASKQLPAAQVSSVASVAAGRGSFWLDAHPKWFPTWRRG